MNTFEANRVSEIREIVPPERWKHVKGNENPADVGSRGILPKDIVNHELWCRALLANIRFINLGIEIRHASFP